MAEDRFRALGNKVKNARTFARELRRAGEATYDPQEGPETPYALVHRGSSFERREPLPGWAPHPSSTSPPTPQGPPAPPGNPSYCGPPNLPYYGNQQPAQNYYPPSTGGALPPNGGPYPIPQAMLQHQPPNQALTSGSQYPQYLANSQQPVSQSQLPSQALTNGNQYLHYPPNGQQLVSQYQAPSPAPTSGNQYPQYPPNGQQPSNPCPPAQNSYQQPDIESRNSPSLPGQYTYGPPSQALTNGGNNQYPQYPPSGQQPSGPYPPAQNSYQQSDLESRNSPSLPGQYTYGPPSQDRRPLGLQYLPPSQNPSAAQRSYPYPDHNDQAWHSGACSECRWTTGHQCECRLRPGGQG